MHSIFHTLQANLPTLKKLSPAFRFTAASSVRECAQFASTHPQTARRATICRRTKFRVRANTKRSGDDNQRGHEPELTPSSTRPVVPPSNRLKQTLFSPRVQNCQNFTTRDDRHRGDIRFVRGTWSGVPRISTVSRISGTLEWRRRERREQKGDEDRLLS